MGGRMVIKNSGAGSLTEALCLTKIIKCRYCI